MKPGFWYGTAVGWTTLGLLDFIDIVIHGFAPSTHELSHVFYVVSIPLLAVSATTNFFQARK